MTNYPEHDKLSAIQPQSQAGGEPVRTLLAEFFEKIGFKEQN